MGIVLEPISFVGLDLGETQARLIQLNHTTEKPTLVAAGSVNLPLPWEQNDKPVEDAQIVDKLKQLMGEVGVVTDNVVFALPEAEVFTRIIEMPSMPKEEMNQAIQFEAESYVPFPLEEVQMDWQVLDESSASRQSGKTRALLVAAPLKIIERYVSIMESAGLRPLAIETGTIAHNRTVSLEDINAGCMGILDIGSSRSVFAISFEGTIRLTHNIPFGGKHITEAIGKQLSIQDHEAEKLKLGLDKLDEIQRESVLKAYANTMESIIEEIRRSVRFFQTQSDGRQISEVVVSGRGTNLYNFTEDLQRSLGLKITRVDPWSSIKTQAALTPKQLSDMAPAFSVAIGLALRNEK